MAAPALGIAEAERAQELITGESEWHFHKKVSMIARRKTLQTEEHIIICIPTL